MQVKKFEAKTMKEALELVKVHMGPEAIILSAKDTHRGFGLMGEKSVEVTAAVSDEVLRKKKIAEAKLREDLRERFNQIPAAKQRQFINKVYEQKTEERREMAMAAAVRAPLTAESRAQTKGMCYIDIEDESEAHYGQAPQRQAQAHVQHTYTQQQAYNQGYAQGYSQQQEYVQSQARTQAPAAYKQPAPAAQPTNGRDRVRIAAEMARQASQEVLQDKAQPVRRSARVTAAARAAATAAMATFDAPPAQPSVQAAVQTAVETNSADVRALESQVRELKALVERFQTIPQIPMTMHPGAEQGISFESSGIYQRLTSQGLQPQLATAMLRKAHKEIDAESIKKPALVDAWAIRYMLNTVETTPNPTAARYHVFMGSAGQGKTSTLVKFAPQLVMKEKKRIAIISLDTMKLGGTDQIRLYAQVLNVPFAIVRNPQEWQVAQAKLAHVAHILVDCPGSSLRSQEEVEWFKRMLPPAEFNRSLHFVQSILARDEETNEIATRFQALGFNDVIFTRLDEASRQGLMINFQDRFKVPIHSFSFGPRIPEDYEFATKERVVDFIFKLSKMTK